MLLKALDIAFLYLKTTFHEGSVLIFSIAIPLLFTFILGQAIQGPGDPPTSWALAVVDEDQRSMSQSFIARLEADPVVDVQRLDREIALVEVEDEGVLAALIIPSGFSAAVLDGKEVQLEFHRNGDEIAPTQILEQAIIAASTELDGYLTVGDLSTRVADEVGLFQTSTDTDPEDYFDDAFTAAEAEWEGGAPFAVTAQQVTRLETAEGTIPAGASQSSPGMLVMWVLFFTFGGGTALLVERSEGTLRRLLVMPMGKGTIMAGKLLGVFIGAIIQMALMILAGQFLFGVNWGQSPIALMLMLFSYGFTGTALGLLVAAVARTTAQANALGTIFVLSLASLGGAWWPIEIVPDWMKNLALALPTGWAMRGFHDIVTRGLGVVAVVPEVGVLIGFGLVFLGVGVWRFRWE